MLLQDTKSKYETMMMDINNGSSQMYNAVSLLLAEKRTSLAVLRTAIAGFTLPLSVFTVLIATSEYYDISALLFFIIPLLAICFFLGGLGSYLIVRSFRRIKSIDHKIQEIMRK
jgi:positive regulator of sigma E activity